MNDTIKVTHDMKLSIESQDYGTLGKIHTYTKRWNDGSSVKYYTAEKDGVMSKRYWRRGNAVNFLFK